MTLVHKVRDRRNGAFVSAARQYYLMGATVGSVRVGREIRRRLVAPADRALFTLAN